LADVEGTVEMDLEHAAPVVSGEVLERLGLEDAGIAHDRVEAAELVDGRLHDRLAVEDGLVRGHSHAARGANLGDDLVGDALVVAVAVHGGAEVVDHHRSTAPGQLQRVQPPQPAARTGDDHGLVVEGDHGGDGTGLAPVEQLLGSYSVSDLDRLRLLASAIAGCTLEVAAAEPGQPTWTDGRTVYVEAVATRAEQVQMLGVQASLLAAGSLAPDRVRPLARRPAQLRRYLAVEGQRALAANEDVLPPVVRRLIDRAVSVDDLPRVFGTINVRQLLAAADRPDPGPAAAAPSPASTELVEPADEIDGEETLGNLLASPIGGGGAVGKLFKKLLSPARERGGGGPPGTDAPTHASARADGGGRTVMSSASSLSLEGTADAVRSGTWYPEWDVHRGRYRPDWCTVVESDPPASDASVTPLPDGLALRRALARLGVGLTRCRRQRQGDDIDIDAAVETRVDTLAGSPHDDDFYIESLRQRRDLSVLVLLDVSGSAGEPGTAGRPVHEHQRTAAAALTTALHDLGDRVALYAFNSRGRQAVQVMRVKSFADHLDGAVARRLSSLAPGAYTRLGAAIRHGTSILEERGGTPRRLLVVLSDGFAYDHGYEGRYGEADARRALVEARRRGVGCLCLSVGADTDPEALRRVFGAAAHATVPRGEQLPRLIGPLFRAALRTAEAQRRAFQRTERTRERHEVERRTA
jgi:hypothetical protein